MVTDPAALRASLAALAGLPGVAEAADAAREACTRLRFHEALRRRIPEAAAESRVRGARASAALDGASMPVDLVRDRVRGAVGWSSSPDPVEQVVRAATRVTSEAESLASLVFSAPLQVVARLHVAAMSGLLPDEQVGRPRRDDEPVLELVDLGEAPPAPVVDLRLAALAELLTAPRDGIPVVVLAGLAHAEVATVRPFVRGNGLVARALERVIVQAGGLDPTGVAVPEVGHLGGGAGGSAAYLGALTAYATGGGPGVALWLRQCADAVVVGAAEGEAICEAVRAGRLG